MKISEAFTECGSDKNTDHSYGDFYDDLVNTRSILSVLEIGVDRGYSLSAWKKHNPAINVLGVDLTKSTTHPTVVAVTPEYAPVLAYCKAHGCLFDLIVDDGGHQEVSQVLGLYFLREFLSPSGVYVIEDIQNDDIAARMERVEGCHLIDLRHVKNRYDDVLAVWYNK